MPSIETSQWMALKARIQSLTLSPALPVVWPKGVAPASGKYLRADWVLNRVQRRAVSSDGAQIRPGILQLSIFSPISPSEAAEVDMELAGQIAEHFPTDHRMTFGGVSVRVQRAPSISQAYRTDAYWITPVSVFVETLA
ncbi:phage tail terminator-like protein [Shinella granuli]|uniref:Uncharacterized protein DUF4128 n=1 Tax=Shinella granuli TaxID=323621 RepID=A0A4R2BS19_SHIGR|nr:phage tail terminator-like protein [Shinella granuli]TCN30527.1 uncharacterized protein DUF4128 [Shinella granuli]